MMRRTKTGIVVLAALIAVVGIASAAYIYLPGATLSITPQSFSVAPGGTTKILINYTTPVDAQTSGSHTLTYNVISGFPVNVSVVSIYYYDKTTGTNVSVTPFASYPAGYGGGGNVSWNGQAGTYYITVQIGASPSATPGTSGSISFSGSSVNATFTATSLTVYASAAVSTAYPSITPEFFTLALVGVGAAAIVLLRRRGF